MEYIALGIFFLLSAGYFTAFGLTVYRKNGFRQQDVETVTGQLTGQTVERQIAARRYSERKQKKTVVTYSYQVNGVKYDCECTLLDRFKAVPASTKVVYQRKRPQMSYLPEFEEPDTKGMRGFYLSGALFFLLSALLFLFIGI